ncbi:MAG TPA: tetratricopeptide repeat protein [Myxococcota bacterium]|nr:tetratricopeptide repeat protein [Myxococcota bacterium]
MRFAQLVVRTQNGEVPGDEPFAAALADLDAAIAKGGPETRLRARAARARLFALWPGRAADAERAFRERAEQAFADGSSVEQLDAARAAARYAKQSGNAELLRFALEKGVQADPTSEAAWRELVLAEERAGGSADPILARLRAARPDDAAAVRLHALLLVERGRIEPALAELAAAAAEHPDDPEILEMWAHVLFDYGRNAEGAEILQRLQRDHPHALATKRAQAREALRAGRPAEAIPLLAEDANGPSQLDAQLLLAAAYFQTGRLDAATAAIERAKELGGRGAPRVLLLEVRIDQGAGRWGEVLRDYRDLRALGVQARPAELTAVAEALYETGRVIPARSLLEKVLAGPDPPAAAVLELARREGATDPERTARLLEAALARTPADLRLVVALAASEAARGDVDGALRRLDTAAKTLPPPPPIPIAWERARILSAAKRDGEAEAELLALLERAPEVRPALDLLVEIYRRQGALDRNVAGLAERAKRGELTPVARVLLARLARAAGDDALARAELERALAERDDLPGAKRDLAALLLQSGGDDARARTLAEAARAALPGDPESARVLGAVLLRAGDPAGALDALDAARDLARGVPDAALDASRGAALEALGRKRAARAAFAAALRAEPANAEARAALERLGGG